jgi:uncharacterized protein (TIGR02147 family)
VTSYLSHRDFLQALYDDVKAERPSYSYYQLAEDLGFSRTNVLWLVITGRRRLTERASGRISAALQLSGNARRYFEALQKYATIRRADQRETCFQDLLELKGRELAQAADQMVLEYFSEWYHPIIREMAGIAGFQYDAEWINQHLVTRLPPLQIQRSLQLLERLNLIEFDQKKRAYVHTKKQILPDREVERLASVRFHQKMCDAARDAVTRIPARRREINSLTICVSDADAMKVGVILYKACEEIMQLEAQCKDRDQVYQVNVHLFPFTRKPEDHS